MNLLKEGPLINTSEELQQQLLQIFQSGFNNLEKFFTDADKRNAQAFFHGHPQFMLSTALASQYIYGDAIASDDPKWTVRSTSPKDAFTSPRTNPSIIPDNFFLSSPTIGVFTIRHPLLMVPSIYRTIVKTEGGTYSEENLRFSCTLRWSRMLYDWFTTQGIPAYVVDAKEYMSTKTVKPFMRKLCGQVGLDADAVIYEWQKATPQELASLPGFVVEIKKDILESKGLKGDKDAGDVVAEQEEDKWKEEFGDEVVDLLKDLVGKTMADYEYMRARAIRI
jgi:hypothetical protein